MCCDNAPDGRGPCSKCLVYKDPIFMTAQVLSIVAVFFSWGFWLTGILGFAAMVMLQTAWCCRMNKWGIITAGIFACLDGLGCFIVGIAVFVVFADHDSDSYYRYDSEDDTAFYYDGDTANAWGAICMIGAVLWVAVGVCCFVFVFCKLEKLQRLEMEAYEGGKNSATPSAVAVEMPQPVVQGYAAPPEKRLPADDDEAAC